MGNIEWNDLLSGGFIKLEDGKPKKLVLSNWKPQEKFKDEKTGELRKGITFTVLAEDDKVYEDEDSQKEYTVTAIRALVKLRPIIEKAEAAGKDFIKVNIVRVGEGRKTEYSISEVQ